MADMTGVKTVVLVLILCFSAWLTKAQVTFSPDPEEDVRIQIVPLTPPVEVTTARCFSSSPNINVQYVTADTYEVVFDIYKGLGVPIPGNSCGQDQRQYMVRLNSLQFIEAPVFVGGTFRLKAIATLDNNEGNSTFSRRTCSFPAPFNLTGSSISALVNSPFTWTCHVTSDFPLIEWYKESSSIGQVGILHGACENFEILDSYTYKCQESALTYTLTIPAINVTEKLQDSTWRCKDITDNLKGSKFIKLDIFVPVSTVTIFPGSGSTFDVFENQSVNFTCTTNNANPPPTIIWFLGSSDVTSQAGPNSTTLTLHVTILYHQMSVKCMAWNSGNTANPSDSTILNIKSSSKFITDRRYQVIHLNRTASIGIAFYCNPPVTISGVVWINKTGLNDQPVESSETVSLSLVEDDVDLVIGDSNLTLRGQRALLNITSVQSYHSGYYMLKIQNGASLVSGLGVVIDVSTLPDPPVNLTVQCRESVAHLSWNTPDPESSDLSFHVLYKWEDGETYTVLEKEFDNRGPNQLLSASIKNIKPKTVYHFKVASKNVHGLSEYTETKTSVIFDENMDKTFSGASVGGVAGGITAVFLVLTTVLIIVIVMRERRYRTEKGERSKENKASFEKHDDVQSVNISNEQGAEIGHSQDESSTYEDLQNSRDVHTYDHVLSRTRVI